MEKLFIETLEFSTQISAFLDDDNYRELQTLLMEMPDRGKVIPGCAGVRKIRFANPRRGKGKRGGIRVIYLHVPEQNWIFFLGVYSKSELDNMSSAEKRRLREIVEQLKKR